jgi:hypothetical protein
MDGITKRTRSGQPLGLIREKNRKRRGEARETAVVRLDEQTGPGYIGQVPPGTRGPVPGLAGKELRGRALGGELRPSL